MAEQKPNVGASIFAKREKEESKALRRNNVIDGNEERIRSLTSALSFGFSRKSSIGTEDVNNALKRLSSKKNTLRSSRASLFDTIQKKRYLEFKDNEDFKLVVGILQKYPKYRTDHEIELLKEAFYDVKYIETLKTELSSESIDKLIREMGHEYSKKNDEVFKIGDLGRKFYIILQGKVDVLIKKEGIEDAQDSEPDMKKIVNPHHHNSDDMAGPIMEVKEEDEEHSQAQIEKHMKLRSASSPLKKSIIRTSEAHIKKKIHHISMFPTQLTPEEESELYCKEHYPKLFRARTLGIGDSFGEVALRQNVARTATIVCAEDCHFAILTKDSFQKILAFHYDAINNENLHFLKSISIFRKWAMGNLEQLFYQMELREYFYGSVLFKEDEEATHFYFVKEGEFEVSMLVQEEIEDSHAIKISRNGLYLPELKQKRKRIKLTRLGRSAIIGYKEILEKTRRRTMAVCVSAGGKALVMQKNRFFAFVRNEMSISVLQKLDSNYSTLFGNLLECSKTVQEEFPVEKSGKQNPIFTESSLSMGAENNRSGSKDAYNYEEKQAPLKEERVSSDKALKIYENPLYRLSHKDKLNDEFASHYEVLKSICHDKILHSDKPDLNSHSLIYDMEIPKKYQFGHGRLGYFNTNQLERKTSLGNITEELSPRITRLYKKLESTDRSSRKEDILSASLVEKSLIGFKSDINNENSHLEGLHNKSISLKSHKEENIENFLPSLIKTNPNSQSATNIHMEKHRRNKTMDLMIKKPSSKKITKLARDLQGFIQVKNMGSERAPGSIN